MKKLLLLLISLFAFSALHAQTPIDQGALVAYVNSDRTQILSVRPDGTPTVLVQQTAAVKTSFLSVLASTGDGKSLLVGGMFHFANPNNGAPDSLQGFIRLDSPFTFVGGMGLNGRLGGQRVLHKLDWEKYDPRKPLPLGTLSPNETEWYATWAKNGAAGDDFDFFNGKFDGTGEVKIGQLPDGHQQAPANEYHMTNIAVDDKGIMIAIVVDQLNSDDQMRATLHRWIPKDNVYQLSILTSQIKNQWTARVLDSSFICVLRIIPGQEPPMAELGLMPNDVGNIEFYKFPYNAAGSIGLSPSGRSIPRSAIPDNIFFFTGLTVAPNYGNDGEVLPVMKRHVNGGDMMFSPTGDSVVFITSNAITPGNVADWYASPENSAIWIYDIERQQSYPIYNNAAKMERQPIFMGFIPKFPPPPPPQGYIVFNPDTLKFDTVEVGKLKSLNVTMTNPSNNTVAINSISLPSNEAFTISGSIPDSLKKGEGVTFAVVFSPSVVGKVTASITAKYANSNDSVKILYLTGVGKAKEGVGQEDLARFDVRVHPNPFSGTANIDIDFDGYNGLDVRLVDVLGRAYDLARDATPRLMRLDKNAHEQYKIDRAQLNLAPGSYTLFVKNGERTLARQIILVQE